jgi:hypothetical protein
VLTPGIHNSAFFEHAFLADEMGVELCEGDDLFVSDGWLYMRTTQKPRRVDVVYLMMPISIPWPSARIPTSGFPEFSMFTGRAM